MQTEAQKPAMKRHFIFMNRHLPRWKAPLNRREQRQRYGETLCTFINKDISLSQQAVLGCNIGEPDPARRHFDNSLLQIVGHHQPSVARCMQADIQRLLRHDHIVLDDILHQQLQCQWR